MNPASSENDPRLGEMFDQLRAYDQKHAPSMESVMSRTKPQPQKMNAAQLTLVALIVCLVGASLLLPVYWSNQAPSQASVDFEELDQIVTAHFAEASEPTATPMVWSSPTDSLLSDSLLSDSLRSDARAIDASVDPSELNQSN